MEPKYSIILVNHILDDYHADIDRWLHTGVKVLWFGSNSDVLYLQKKYKAFSDALLLQCYSIKPDKPFIIIDGNDPQNKLVSISRQCVRFNKAQFDVEHCNTDKHIVVRASAGTGKTTVMIDRIMYLLHTVPNIKMSDIFMITFTNEAACQMDQRLQDVLMKRLELTGQRKYVKWVEEQSQMNISTIHSFAFYLLKELGIEQSFTRELSIKSFSYERKELIKDILDDWLNPSESIWRQTGVSFFRTQTLIDLFWKTITDKGISHKDVEALNWGKPLNLRSAKLQNTLQYMIPLLDKQYLEFKSDSDSVSVNDIIRDLYEVLLIGKLHETDLEINYLFVDEFQDTDLSQIKLAAKLVNLFGARLFAVGDVKQSIYRFRGANEQAFSMLDHCLELENERVPESFYLFNNYRTSTSLLERLHLLFKTWGEKGYLDYETGVRAINSFDGEFKIIDIDRNNITNKADLIAEETAIVDVARTCLDILSSRVEGSRKTPRARDRVVILTRTNYELRKVSSVLRKNRIPVSVVLEGSFYSSDAVRDFYSLVCSFMYPDEPKHIFNYLMTPYADVIDPIDVNEMEQFNGNTDLLIKYLFTFLEKTTWQYYYKQLRLRPVMAVIKDIIDQQPVIETYIANEKRRKADLGWEERRNIASTRVEAMQYQADIYRLIEIIERTFNGTKMSIYDLSRFLELQITSNAAENEPEIVVEDDYRSVLCMTVHKAKGLEFDTVIIPYTDRDYLKINDSEELLIDSQTNMAGWFYQSSSKTVFSNAYYDYLSDKEQTKTEQEETRLLYVAMTRAIHKLICLRVCPTKDHTWGHLIDKGAIE